MRISYILPFVPGLIFFLAIFGLAPLNPTNMDWFPSNHDPLQAWLGWNFFQAAPWSFPPGMNPALGLELDNSIVFTDSNPLFALFFKCFASWLPAGFQYMGLWLFTCVILQSWLGWKLCSLYTKNQTACFLGACLFTMSPPMILRMSCHFNLAAHFLILAALYLCLENGRLNRRGKSILWTVLLVVSVLVHFYIFAMVALLWLTDVADRLLAGKITLKYAALEICANMAICAFACWMAGYFIMSGQSSEGGFGHYKANLWTFFDSDGYGSYIMPDLPSRAGENEGFAYLGLGGIFLCLCGIYMALKTKFFRNGTYKYPLLAALAFLLLFSLSNNVGLFIWDFHVRIPNFVEKYAQYLRSSGRMIWPVYYGLLIFSLYIILKNCTPRRANILLLIVIALQIPDAYAMVSKRLQPDDKYMVEQMKTALKDPFWEQAAKKYKKVRVHPIKGFQTRAWHIFSYYAWRHGMGTNVVYLARYNIHKLAAVNQATLDKIKSGNLDEDSFYIVNDDIFEIAKKSVHGALLKKIDGFNVIAPDWQ